MPDRVVLPVTGIRPPPGNRLARAGAGRKLKAVDALTPSQLDPAFPPCAPIDPAAFDWEDWSPALQATLCFIVDEAAGRVLLMRKKRGLGAGKINAPGGKLDPGETLAQCAARETREELGVEALDPRHRGTLWFQFTDGLAMEVAVFLATRWRGEARETDEGAPQWTGIRRIPYSRMWEDDRHWLPSLLAGRHFHARFVFEGEAILRAELDFAAGGWALPGLRGAVQA